jgi:hypothetical protein
MRSILRVVAAPKRFEPGQLPSCVRNPEIGVCMSGCPLKGKRAAGGALDDQSLVEVLTSQASTSSSIR